MPNCVKKSQLGELNLQPQRYKHFEITLMGYNHITEKAARFRLFGTRQNIWIPRKHLDESMTIKPGERIDYVFCSPEGASKLALIIQELKLGTGG